MCATPEELVEDDQELVRYTPSPERLSGLSCALHLCRLLRCL